MHRLRTICFQSQRILANERGIVLAASLLVIVVLVSMGLSTTFSGFTNLTVAVNHKKTASAASNAEVGVNEALYRLSRQEGQPGALAPDMTDPFWNDPNWQVEIDFTSGDTDPTDGDVSTIIPSADWPLQQPADPVIMRYKKPDPVGTPNDVVFYDRTLKPNPPFRTITLPAPPPPAAGSIPITANPVIQILATGLAERGARRQVIAEVSQSVFSSPPAPLVSGVDVNLGGSSFIDGVNHDHRIVLTPTAYGDDNDETTYDNAGNQIKDSPDDNALDDTTCGGNPNGHDVANFLLPTGPYVSCPRLFNRFTSSAGFPPAAWVGLEWVGPDIHYGNSHWHEVNQRPAAPIALSTAPILAGIPTLPNNAVIGKGLFGWQMNQTNAPLNSAAGTDCENHNAMVCRPPEFEPFPTFQEYLGLDDVSFQNLLNRADTTKADLLAGNPPWGFTYIEMPSVADEFTIDGTVPRPGDNDYVLIYTNGSLRLNGNQTIKGVFFVEGSVTITGNPTVLGAFMVRGATNVSAGTGNIVLLYSREAARRGLQAGHAWSTLSWVDTELQS